MPMCVRYSLLLVALLLPVSLFAVDYDTIEKLVPQLRIESYEKLIGVEKDSVEILFKLGNACYEAERKEDAARYFRRALSAGGELKVVVNLSYALTDLDRRDEAIREYETYLARSPGEALAYAFFADYLSEDTDIDREIRAAVTEYNKALKIDDKCVEAHFGLGVTFARADLYREAIVEWETVIRLDPKHRLVDMAKKNIKDANRRLGN